MVVDVELGLFLVALGAPLLATALGRWVVDLRRARLFASVLAGTSTLAALAIVASAGLDRALALGEPTAMPDLGKLLVVVPPVLWLVSMVATPDSRLGRPGIVRTSASTSFTVLAFAAASPVLLWVAWAATTALFVHGIATETNRRVWRTIAYYQGAGVLLFAIGSVLVASGGPLGEYGLWLIAGAVLIRKGIFPFHAWVPYAFEQGRIGPSVLFCAPQLGSYVAAVLVLPHASPTLQGLLMVMALLTAVYGSGLALVQTDARRALGYIFVGQSALVIAGLSSHSPSGIVGALVLWTGSAFAFTGISRTVLALEVRRGRQSLDRFHGGYEQARLLAVSFLVFGLACTGFPGTLGFIGQELLLSGLTHTLPKMGFLSVLATSLTGIAMLRMYMALFCGRGQSAPALPLHRREAVVFGALAMAILLLGILPGVVVEAHQYAAGPLLPR